MKIIAASTSLALLAFTSTMPGSVDARVGGKDKYTIYFANPCDEDIDITINGPRNDHSQTIKANTCQVFQKKDYEGPMLTYTEQGIAGATQTVSCYDNSKHTEACNLRGMPSNACVIPLATCPPKPTPPTLPPAEEAYTFYVANKCASNSVQVKIGRQSKDIAADTCEPFSSDNYSKLIDFTEYGAGVISSKLDCSKEGKAAISECDLDGMPDNACVLTSNNCVQTNSPVEKKYTVYVANKCAKNSVNVKIGSDSKDIPANTCQAFSSHEINSDLVTYSEIGSGAIQTQISCSGEGADNVDQCNLRGMPENACVITTSTCVP